MKEFILIKKKLTTCDFLFKTSYKNQIPFSLNLVLYIKIINCKYVMID